MLNIKKTEILLGILLILFISGFFIIQNPPTITKLFLIDSRATQQNVALSVTITGSIEESLAIPVSGEIKPTDSMIKQTIPKITGFSNHENDEIKIRVYTNDTTPQGFTSPPTTLVTTVFNYINITLDTTLTNTVTIYFNITQSNLGSTDANDIRLYRYDSSWTELTTTIINSTSDPASFSAETDSFSRFLIGEKAEVSGLPSVTTPLGANPSQGGLKLGKEQPVPRPKPAVITPIPEKVKKIIQKIIKLPAQLLKYEVSYKAIYTTIAALLIVIIALEAIYYYISHRKE